MSERLIPLRHTISKQVIELPESQVERYLKVWGSVLEPVRVAKPEVLSAPHVIEDGERKPVQKDQEEK